MRKAECGRRNKRRCAPQLYPRRCRGLYRAFGAVISVLRAGYVLRPLGAKLRNAEGGISGAVRRSYIRGAAAGYIAPTGAVMSVLRTGYVLRPLGAKLRCVRRAHTF